jgi:hypothetical protein
MGRNLPDYTQIPYKLLVQPSDPQPAATHPRVGSNPGLKGPFTRYSVDFAIAASDLKLEPKPMGPTMQPLKFAWSPTTAKANQ